MNRKSAGPTADPTRALRELGIKASKFDSGGAVDRAVKGRTRKSRIPAPPTVSVVTRSSAYAEPHPDRDAMIAEAAYYRSAHRGFEPGHEVDDWLAAESDIDAALARGDLPRFMG
jgi:hypothetical protein